MNKKAVVAGVVLVCVMSASIAVAAEGVVGEWEFKSQMQARTSTATMTITKSAEGKYTGKWSDQRGESDLSDVTFENGKLKCARTSNFGGQDVKMTYEGTIEDGKLKGKGTGPRGEFAFEGTLQGEAKTGAEAICGGWSLNVTIPAREVVEKLTVSKNADGALAGKWTAERGESTISGLKFEGGKLTFTRMSNFGGREITSDFEGTVEGDNIKGVFRSDRGDVEAKATRVGASKPEAGKKADANAPGAGKAEPNKPPSPAKNTDKEAKPS